MQGMQRQVSSLVADGRERAHAAICREADTAIETMYANDLEQARQKSPLHELWQRLKLKPFKARYVERYLEEKAPRGGLY
jgi:hypothetical protein